jgi:predicted GIY-YIG superfamily endonuclease
VRTDWLATVRETWEKDRDTFCSFEEKPYELSKEFGRITLHISEDRDFGLTIFITDEMEVGLAPAGTTKNDILWKFYYPGTLPFHAILRASAHDHTKFRVYGRARMIEDLNWEEEFDVPADALALEYWMKSKDEIYRIYMNKKNKKLSVFAEPPILQALTCPLMSKWQVFA